jgi:hypothetical protein
MNEMFVEDFGSLVHNLLTHDNEQLSALEGSYLTKPKVVLNDLDDSFHLVWVVCKLEQNRGKSSCGSRADGVHTVLAELEEHRQKFLVDNLHVE